MLDSIDKLFNRVNDWDLTWVGFRAIRPAPDKNMTAAVVVAFCLVYCPLSALAAGLVSWLAIQFIVPRLRPNNYVPLELPWLIAAAGAVVFLVLQCSLAYFWNRRAAKLRAKSGAGLTGVRSM